MDRQYIENLPGWVDETIREVNPNWTEDQLGHYRYSEPETVAEVARTVSDGMDLMAHYLSTGNIRTALAYWHSTKAWVDGLAQWPDGPTEQ